MSQKPTLVSLPKDAPARAVRDVCEESAYRLNVVLRLLEDHDCHENDQAAATTNGFDLILMQAELQSIRARLQEAS